MFRVWMKSRWVVGLILAGGTLSNRALAEAPNQASATASDGGGAATAKPTASGSAPDVVRLKNGGILRGTIAELVPGEYVSIVLITGETRKVAMAEVEHAGQADVAVSAPAAPPATATRDFPAHNRKDSTAQPFAVVHAAEARVNVISDPEGYTLYRRSASAGFNGGGLISGYDEVCTAPCNVSMPAGTHTFAVAKADGKPREADAVTLPAGESTMKAAYINRTGTRVAGIAIGSTVAAGGIALAFAGWAAQPAQNGVAVTGLGLELIGMSVAVGFGLLKDGAEISITPGVPASAASPTKGERELAAAQRVDARAVGNGLSGLTLTTRF